MLPHTLNLSRGIALICMVACFTGGSLHAQRGSGWASGALGNNTPALKGEPLLEATYKAKMAAGVAAAAKMLTSLAEPMKTLAAGDPAMSKAVLATLARAQADKDIQDATGQNGIIWNKWNEVVELYDLGKDSRTINTLISVAASIPMSVVSVRMETIFREELAKDNPSGLPPEPIIDAILKAPQGVDMAIQTQLRARSGKTATQTQQNFYNQLNF